MKRVLCIIVLVLPAYLISCDKDIEPQAFDLPPEASELIQSDNAFGIDLFKYVISSADVGENVMISPLSISLALSMTYNGAEGATKTEMEEAMKMSNLNRDQINELNKTLVTALLAHDQNVKLDIANSIWYRNDFTVKDDFITQNRQFYDAEVLALDFSDPGSKDEINNWVAAKTNDKIEEIVDQIKPESFMFLINAIYFKGDWRFEFDSRNTRDGDFQISDTETVSVPMMNQEVDVNTLKTELFSAVELPYGKGNWSMFVLVPNHDKSVDDVLDELNGDSWNDWTADFTLSSEVDLTIPKFTFEFEKSLKDILISMGMERAFLSSADFSGILDGGGIQISEVKHKTFIEVNEKGTEAAAVTSVEIELTSMGNYFYANRPFVFVIAEKSSHTILFVGRLTNPKQ